MTRCPAPQRRHLGTACDRVGRYRRASVMDDVPILATMSIAASVLLELEAHPADVDDVALVRAGSGQGLVDPQLLEPGAACRALRGW